MFLTEWDQEKVLAQAVNEERRNVAIDMLRDGEPIAKIIKYSRLAENTIRNLANTLDLTIL